VSNEKWVEQVGRSTGWPAWAQSIREQYLAGEASTFILHGNVFDVVMHEGKLLDLRSFVADVVVGGTKTMIVEVTAEHGARAIKSQLELQASDLVGQLHLVEEQLRTRQGVGVIIPYADLLAPSEDQGSASAREKLVGAVLHRWSLDRELQAADNIVVMLVESLASLNSALVSSPKVAAIRVPMPDHATRQAAVEMFAPRFAGTRAAKYAKRLGGLRVVQIEGLMKGSGTRGLSEEERRVLIARLLEGQVDAAERAERFSAVTAGMTEVEVVKLIAPHKESDPEDADEALLKLIQERKRSVIEKECAGLIEFVEPKYGLDAVGGAEHIKEELQQIAANLRSGDTTVSPMGLMAVGPMGAGKTFVLKAFLKEAGLAAVALKNFRSKWVGSTEANLERVLATVRAMGPIAVLIDEGDRSFGNSGGEGGDDGTSSRVIARLKDFMSDPENRGNVLIVLLTNRPDKLDTDIKRPGRLDRKIPFFYCESAAERAAVMRAVLRRHVGEATPSSKELEAVCESLDGYSNADIEQVALLGIEFDRRDEKLSLLGALEKSRDDFIPPQEHDMLEFMELLAVSETSRRSLLPEKFRRMSVGDIQGKLAEARLRALAR
jgi:transitional endoplasmic reticulum ATPase